MTAQDRKKLATIENRWATMRRRFPDHYKNNLLFNLIIKEVAEDVLWLVEQAWASGRVEEGSRREATLKNLQMEYEEFSSANVVSIEADPPKKAPMGLRKVIQTIEYLCGLAKPLPEPEQVIPAS